ncbi:uncharacterized protein RSE6_10965 [Rhynchosporium secalis]|uniref:Uncharacterized protein n=1 Tax=Rhynchosporium secalis TaxID=38038 RepID=A0A1E1MLS5_RHYSE|nr:uncharacterized protein RSE6_10965 [Rhynchosporium secalis]
MRIAIILLSLIKNIRRKAAGSTIYSPRRLSLYRTSVDASGVEYTNGCNPS